MKHNSYYATMAQIIIQVKMASLFFNIVLQIKIFKTGTRGVNIWPQLFKRWIALIHRINRYPLDK